MKRWRSLCWPGLLLLGLLPCRGMAGGGRESEPFQRTRPDVHLSMKPAAAGVDAAFQLPVYLETAPAVRLSSLTFEIEFPREGLSFIEMEKGRLLRSGPFEVTAAPAGRTEALETVRIRLFSTGQEDPSPPLPSGLLGYVGFRTGAGLEPGDLTVQNRILSAEKVGGDAVPPERCLAESETVSIVSEDMIMIACFFYMH